MPLAHAVALHAPSVVILQKTRSIFWSNNARGYLPVRYPWGQHIGSIPRLVYRLYPRLFSRLSLIDQKILHHHFRMIHLGLQPQIPELPCQLLQPPLLLVLPPAGFEKRRVRPRDRLNITYLTCIEPHVQPR